MADAETTVKRHRRTPAEVKRDVRKVTKLMKAEGRTLDQALEEVDLPYATYTRNKDKVKRGPKAKKASVKKQVKTRRAKVRAHTRKIMGKFTNRENAQVEALSNRVRELESHIVDIHLGKVKI